MSSVAESTHHVLLPHAASPPGPVRDMHASVQMLADDLLSLRYTLAGDIDQLKLPEPRSAVRADGLWRHTCFEAFIRAESAPAYWEFNLSPSSGWAAYQFAAYREGMAPLLKGAAPEIALDAGAGQLTLSAQLDLSWLVRTGATRLRLGLAAVIEERSGVLSYWALAHCGGKPDFHHADSFIVSLT